MRLTMPRASAYSAAVFAVLTMGAPALHASAISPGRQTALVMKYCAVCHTDAARNGGLSLQRYDAGKPDPALAAMLLSKLRNGAMGAAGLGVPDKETQAAWVAATTEQATGAEHWTVVRNGAVLTASIVRDVAPRSKNDEYPPLYRLTMACDTKSLQGETQLTWSPSPQNNRTFTVSADGGAGVEYKLEGKAEPMGNGQPGGPGLAAANLHAPLAAKVLTVRDLFPGEQVDFPIGELDGATRRQMAGCIR